MSSFSVGNEKRWDAKLQCFVQLLRHTIVQKKLHERLISHILFVLKPGDWF